MTIRARAAAWGLVALAGLGFTSAASALDDWEQSGEADDGITTDNALFHGAEQDHSLQGGNVPDQDWYIVSTRPFSSYQVVVFGLTGGINLTTTGVQLMNAAGTQVFQNALVTDAGGVLSLQWHQGIASGPSTAYVRVFDPDCISFLCPVVDSYRIRFYDTTYTVPGVDNSGTQSSVLLVQNATDRACTMAHHYFSVGGAYLASGPLVGLAAYGQAVIDTAATMPGQSGSVRITHTCGYGALSGKAVTIDAATGIAFDTPLVHRAR